MKPLKRIAVECRNLSLSYDGGKTDVLENINLRIEPGEFFALLGPSGSGKSTLLRAIAGFNQPQRGQIVVDGNDITDVPPHQRNIGMVFQNYALWPHMSVWENVAFGLQERRMDSGLVRQKVGTVLELVGLSQYADRRPYQLSGGQQQRVALARTVVIEPQVLLLDEPLSNLDKQLRVQMRTELRSLQRTLGITTLFVTHDQEEAMATADRLAVMDKGVIEQLGTPMALFDYPSSSFIAGFVGTANLLSGDIRMAGDMICFRSPGVGEVMLPKHPSVRAGQAVISFRPHTIRMTVSDAARDGAYVWFDGTVEQREFLGEFTRYRVRVGEALIIADQPHFSGMAPFAERAMVLLGIDTTQIRYLQE